MNGAVPQEQIRNILAILGQARRYEVREGYFISRCLCGTIYLILDDGEETAVQWHLAAGLGMIPGSLDVVPLGHAPLAGFFMNAGMFHGLDLEALEAVLEEAQAAASTRGGGQ